MDNEEDKGPMRIAVTFEYFSPAYKGGGPIQSLEHMVQNFAQDSIELYVYCSDGDLGGGKLNVEANRWLQYTSNCKVYYASAEQPIPFMNIQKAIDPDVLYINGIFSRQFSVEPLLSHGKAKKILAVRGMLHPGALGQKSLKKKLFLAAFKLKGLHRKCEFHVTTEEEAGYVRQHFGADARIWVVPNFPKTLGYMPPARKYPGMLHLVTVALISPMKNIKLVIEALASCSARIVYHIYGPVKDEKYWDECKDAMQQLPANITVEYKGAVAPSRVAEALQEYHAMIQPSESENFGHSIFEALSAGKPVITSKYTPWNQLEENKAGYNVDLNVSSVKNSIEEMAAFDQSVYSVWTQHAYTYAMNRVDLPSIKAGYKKMFGIV